MWLIKSISELLTKVYFCKYLFFTCILSWFQKEVTKFNYKVRSSGAYLVDFEAYFVDVVDSVIDVANYSPCLGKNVLH